MFKENDIVLIVEEITEVSTHKSKKVALLSKPMAIAIVTEACYANRTNVQIKESFDDKYPLDKLYCVPNSFLTLVFE